MVVIYSMPTNYNVISFPAIVVGAVCISLGLFVYDKRYEIYEWFQNYDPFQQYQPNAYDLLYSEYLQYKDNENNMYRDTRYFAKIKDYRKQLQHLQNYFQKC